MMKDKRCLYCYQILTGDATDFHLACSRKFFGTEVPPTLEYAVQQMQELANEIVNRSITVTGVQPKLPLTIEKIRGDTKKSRFTNVALWGNFILKPPSDIFPNLPENEDLTMHLATIFGIPAAEHSLIRLQSGELSYITKRFDRINGAKLPLEDMCQLTETLTSDKYRSSMEKIGKCIAQYSSNPGFDAITFFEIALFCYLTGNADMHLKNFSLIGTMGKVGLSPAYDLVCTKMAMPEDKEEVALTINAKKRKLKRSDFDSLAKGLKIPEKPTMNSYKKFAASIENAYEFIDISFLPKRLKQAYREVINKNTHKLEL